MILLALLVRVISIIGVLILYMAKRMNFTKLFICILAIGFASMISNGLHAQSTFNQIEQGQIIDNTAELELKLYPNPVTDYVTLSSNQSLDGKFKLSNIVGKIILEGDLEGKGKTINLFDYRTGIYIISIYDREGKKLATRKIIKN